MNRLNISALIPVAVAFCQAACVSAAESRIELKDWTGRGFAPDLVRYTIRLPSGGAQALRLQGPDGKPEPLQVSAPQSNGAATLSFVAWLPPNGTNVYVLRDDGLGPIPPPAVNVTRDKKTLILSADRLAVRVPAPGEKKFSKPVPAQTLPAPILGFRSGMNAMIGGGRMLSSRRVSAYRVTLLSAGPVFAAVRYELDFANGGFYRAEVRVTHRSPLVHVREEYDARELDGTDYWALNLTDGWSPDLMEIATTMGNSGVDKGQIVPLAQLGATPHPVTARWVIVPDSAWHTPRSQLGLLKSADHSKVEEKDRHGKVIRVWDEVKKGATIAGVVPLHKGDWRRATGIEIHTPDSRRVSLHLPISVRPARSEMETTAETGASSFHEHDPALSRTYGRRVWGLVLAAPELRTVTETEQPCGPFYQARLFYGVVGLDSYKNYLLEWPDKQVVYPRVFLRADQVAQYRQTLAQSPVGETLRRNWYILSGDAALARKRTDTVKRSLAYLANFMFISPTVGHHKMATAYLHAATADDALSWPDLPAEDRKDIRARLALVTYLMQDADVMSYGNGTHTGNANMAVARTMSMCNFMALLPDHPMFPAWRDHMAQYVAYKIGSLMAPGGAWGEFGGSYHIHSLSRINNAVMGLQSAQAGNLDQLYGYLAPDWEYYLNLLTPVDSRWHSRMVPGLANSPPSFSAHLLETAGLFADRDPTLAAKLKWAWWENGFTGSGAGGDLVNNLNGIMERPWIRPEEPKLASRVYPGLGVIFRAHQGPEETYLLFRSGFHWGHWYIDQGHFILMSKGATLVPFQPYQYWHREWGKDQAFDRYNILRFGHVLNDNPSGWPDSNILDYSFGNSVEYAWSSSTFPAGHSQSCRLDEQPGQKRGPFTWNRQVMFLKGLTAKSPNYFVFRDTMAGEGRLANWLFLNLLGRKRDIQTNGTHIAVDTEWPTKLDLVFARNEPLAVDLFEENLPLVFWGGSMTYWREINKDKPISPNWVQANGEPMVHPPKNNVGTWEQHVFLRIPGSPGQEYFWMVYPRGQNESLPPLQQLAPGVMKITTAESTDYVFLSASPIVFQNEDVAFTGCAGAVRIRNQNVELSLTGGNGKVGYKGFAIEGTAPLEQTVSLAALPSGIRQITAPSTGIAYHPTLENHALVAPGVRKATTPQATEYRFHADGPAPVQTTDGTVRIAAREGAIHIGAEGIRFVVLDSTYAELAVGPVGVRGLGPFDLTLTDDTVAGTVAGRTRTLVCTWPKNIVRPMYHMDGTRWAAGYAATSNPATGDPIQDATRTADSGEKPAASQVETPAPQFRIAFGVTDGHHTVDVREWTWPELPRKPEQRILH